MSMMLMVEAMKAKVGSPGRKLVLVKLADNANDKGECWPSYQHVADQCEMGRSTVKAHIKALEEAGFLTVVERNGGKSSNRYRLHIDAGKVAEKPKQTRSESDPVKNEPGQNSDTPWSESDPHPRSNPDPRTSHSPEPVIEPVDDAGASSSTQAVDCADQPVDQSEKAHHDAIFGYQGSAPLVPALSVPDGRLFSMPIDWQPTANGLSDHCRLLRIDLAAIDPDQQEEILGEFISYWIGKPGERRTQTNWERALALQIQWVLGKQSREQSGASGKPDWHDDRWADGLNLEGI